MKYTLVYKLKALTDLVLTRPNPGTRNKYFLYKTIHVFKECEQGHDKIQKKVKIVTFVNVKKSRVSANKQIFVAVFLNQSVSK